MRIIIAFIWLILVSFVWAQAPIQRNWYSTNVTGSIDPRWTNRPVAWPGVTSILEPIGAWGGGLQIVTNKLPSGDESTLIAFGFPKINLSQYSTNNRSCIFLGDSTLALGATVKDSAELFFLGPLIARGGDLDTCTFILATGENTIGNANLTNCNDFTFLGSRVAQGSTMINCNDFYALTDNGIDGTFSGCTDIMAIGGTFTLGADFGATQMTNSTQVIALGTRALETFKGHTVNRIHALGHSAGSMARLTQCDDIVLLGHNCASNWVATAIDDVILVGNNLNATATLGKQIVLGRPDNTNVVAGRLQLNIGASMIVGPNPGILTNVLYGSAALNFASTSSGAIEDLAITVTGAADGDIVSVGVPQTAATGIIGSYMGFASNNTVFVRFIPTAATQNPNSGTFKVMVHKFQ